MVTPYGFQGDHAIISATAAGSTEVVAAKTGQRIRVVQFYFISSDTNTVYFSSAADAITGEMDFSGQEMANPSHNPYGHFSTESGEALNINISRNNKIAGWLTYFTD